MNHQTESEIGLDNFSLEPPKAVSTIKAEQLQEKSGITDSQGKVQTFTKIEDTIIKNLDGQVDEIVKGILSSPVHSPELKNISDVLNQMGNSEITKTSNMSSRFLDRPLRAMRQNESEGDSVATALKSLRQKVTELDPSKRDSLINKTKFLGIKLPFNIGNKVDSYMQEFKSSQDQLNEIVKSLYRGKDELIEDNAHIDVEREQMHTLMQKLEQYAYVIKRIDKRIEDVLPTIEADDKMKASDIKQEILFPLRQKSMGIYQHLAVCMQGYMALQVVKQNNKELIRGVDSATNTTISALRTAVIVSEALGTQKLVLDQITSVNDTTNKLIEQNAMLLGTQGVSIQKQASESAVNAQTLEKAFQQIFKAMDSIDEYREKALPNMKKTVESLELTVNNAKNYLSNKRNERISETVEEILEEKPSNEAVKIKI